MDDDNTFELIDQPNGEELRVRFRGPFEGREVTWLATLTTRRATGSQFNVIEIGKPKGDGIPLTVILDLPLIDLPTVRKCVIMIRNYKRLHRGRHQFGADSQT